MAHEVCDGSERDQDEREYFYLGACSQGKIVTSYLMRTISPTHTDVRVFMVFV